MLLGLSCLATSVFVEKKPKKPKKPKNLKNFFKKPRFFPALNAFLTVLDTDSRVLFTY